MKKLFLIALMVSGLVSGAFAASVSYNSYYAKNYTVEQVLLTGSDTPNKWNYWFKSWTDRGGNCTNFANQVIRAGLAQTTSPGTIYKLRSSYNIDGSWYYDHYSQSSSWRGAQELYDYANSHLNGDDIGMNFTFQTYDTIDRALNFSA